MALHVSELPAPTRTSTQILARCCEVTQPALRASVQRLHQWPRRMAAFSFGWCDVDGGPSARGAGKGVRQALAILSAEAAGGSPEAAIPGAVAVELVHAFSLVHDDIMDGDEERRHRATVWKAYGTGPAILAGDALFALAVETLATAENEHAGAAMALIATALVELVAGQAEDIDFETRPWTGPDAVGIGEYQTMAEHKTGALLACATAIGAVLAGAAPELWHSLSRAGRHLGLVFQVVDDLLGIWGDPMVTGKPVFSDLRRGKKTLPTLAAISSGSRAGQRLAELLESQKLDEAALQDMAELLEDAGGRSFAQRHAQQHLDHALQIFAASRIRSPAAQELSTLATFLLNRSS